LSYLRKLGGKHTDIIHARDENGWQAIHEAARGGFLEVVQYLVMLGADITATTVSMQVRHIWSEVCYYSCIYYIFG